jgi:hypothetical protein
MIDLRRQWEELLEQSTTNKTLKQLRSKYRGAIRKQDSFLEGVRGEGLDDSYKLAMKQKSQQGIESKLFQKGVRTNLASRNGLIGRLRDPDTLGRLKKVLPEADLNKFDTAVQVENVISDTAKALQRGLDRLEGGVAAQTVGGKTRAKPESIIEALSGKRAYSPIGGVFLLGNEALEAINRTDLPEAVTTRITQYLTKTGPDGERFIQEILDSDLPKYQKEKVFRALRKTMLNAMATGTVATGTTVQDAMSGT